MTGAYVYVLFFVCHVSAYDNEIVWESIDPTIPYEYFFSQNYTLHKTHSLDDLIYHMELDWYGAREWCKKNGGGDLLDIRSAKEAKKIKEKLSLFYTDKLFLFWTGINDMNRDQVWTWEDGDNVSWSWISREVTDSIYVGIEDSLLTRLCSNVHFSPSVRLLFRRKKKTNTRGTIEILPRNCGTRYPFVCKRKKGVTAPINFTQTDWTSYIPTHFRNDSGTCPTESITIGNKCVFIMKGPMKDWDQATKYCRNQYGVLADLVGFQSEDDILSVLAGLKPSRQGYWTGFMKEWSPLRKPLYLWADGSRVVNFTWTDKWLRDENPKRSWRQVYGSFRIPAEKDRDCAFIKGSSSTAFQVTKCNVKRSFICQIDRRDLKIATATTSSSVKSTTEFTSTKTSTTLKSTTSTVATTSERQTTTQSTAETAEETTAESTSDEISTEEVVTSEMPERFTELLFTEAEITGVSSGNDTIVQTTVTNFDVGENLTTESTRSTIPPITTPTSTTRSTVPRTTTITTTPTTTRTTTTASTTPTTTVRTTKPSTRATTMKPTMPTSSTITITVSTSTTERPCRDDFVSVADACYKVVENRGTFDEAELVCQTQYGAHLASVESSSENAGRQMLARSNLLGPVWLGLKLEKVVDQYASLEDQIFFWKDGRPMFYSNFHEYPDPVLFEENFKCAVQGRSMYWSMSKCDVKLPFICKYSRHPGPSEDDLLALKLDSDHYCPSGLVGYGDICFEYDTSNNRETSFRSAMESCLELGRIHMSSEGLLAVPNTDFKQKFTTYVVNRHDHPSTEDQSDTEQSYWVGIYRGRNGKIISVGESDISGLDITSEESDRNDCVVLVMDDDASYLKWENCDSSHSYVCTVPKLPRNQKETIAPDSGCSVHCPDEGNWKQFQGHCYQFLPNHFKSWSEANKVCESHNAGDSEKRLTLASIHSTTENRFIQTYMKEHNKLPMDSIYWIGAYHHPELGWRWTDGSPFGYDNWIHSQGGSDNYLQDWKCVAVSEATGMWIETDCSEMRGAVCKIVAKAEPMNSGTDITTIQEMSTEQDVTTESNGNNEVDNQDNSQHTGNFKGVDGKLKGVKKGENVQSAEEDNEAKHSLSKKVIVILPLLGLLLVLIFVVLFLMFKRQKLKKLASRRMSTVTVRRKDSERRNILNVVDLPDAVDQEETTA